MSDDVIARIGSPSAFQRALLAWAAEEITAGRGRTGVLWSPQDDPSGAHRGHTVTATLVEMGYDPGLCTATTNSSSYHAATGQFRCACEPVVDRRFYFPDIDFGSMMNGLDRLSVEVEGR